MSISIKQTAQKLLSHHKRVRPFVVDKEKAFSLLRETQVLMFPILASEALSLTSVEERLIQLRDTVGSTLLDLEVPDASEIAVAFVEAIPALQEKLSIDCEAIYQGDPAAKSTEEVLLTYPGFFAITAYRIAHFFHQRAVPLLPRILSEFAHQQTGIDIHPGAVIGDSFCIDHGTGVVIGETTTIGNRVKIYQGVTLGALSVEKQLSHTKRHPTVEDGVIIYANTTVLGGGTVIGQNSVIGGNVWLTESVPAHSTVYRRFEIEVKPHKKG